MSMDPEIVRQIREQSERVPKLVAAFDSTGVTWHDRAAALAAFREGHEISENENGELVADYDGENGLTLSEVLLRFAYDRRELVDGRTLPKTSESGARSFRDSKANYPTVEARVEFIQKNGSDAWAELPMTASNETREVTTREDFRELPIEEKCRLVAERGADFVEKLPSRPDPNRAAGGFINHAALEHQRRVRSGDLVRKQ